MNCKNCGQEIDKKAVVCTGCGCKIKKPFYKKWWFWLIVVVIIGIMGSSSGGRDTSTSTENKKTEIYIGIKEKCTVDELEKALKAEIQNRKENDIHKTTSYSALEFLEHEIKTSSDSSEIIEIKRK